MTTLLANALVAHIHLQTVIVVCNLGYREAHIVLQAQCLQTQEPNQASRPESAEFVQTLSQACTAASAPAVERCRPQLCNLKAPLS